MTYRSKRVLAPAFLIGVIFAALVAWTHTARSEGGEPRFFAITNARIVPVSGSVIESGSVVVAKGLIWAVGTTVTVPPEASVIDGKGLTVYPGLIDAGTNLGMPPQEGGEEAGGGGRVSRRAQPSGGISRSPEDRPGTTPWRIAADELKIDDKRIEMWRSAGFTTALTTPEGGILPGQGSVIDLAGDRPGDFVVRAAATLQISFNPIGRFAGFPDSLMGTIAYVRQILDDALWYGQAEPVYDANINKYERLPYDRAEPVINRAIHDKEIVLVPANNSIQILRGLRLGDEWKIPIVLYGGQQGYAVASTIAAKKASLIVSLKWPSRAKDADPEAEQALRELRFRDRAPSTPAVFAKAGVRFAFYSDGLPGPKDIFKNVRKALGAGLPPDAALRAFTLDAAGILDLSDRLGSIEPGKIANLVVTDGDIFSEKMKVRHVFVDGRSFEIHEEAPPEKAAEKKVTQSASLPAARAGVSR